MEGIKIAPEIGRPQLFSFKVINGTIADEGVSVVVNTNIAPDEYVSGVIIVFGVIGKDCRFPVADYDILFGNGYSADEPGLLVGGDIDGKLPKASELRGGLR